MQNKGEVRLHCTGRLPNLDAVASTREDPGHLARLERVHNASHTCICTSSEEEETGQNDTGIDNHRDPVQNWLAVLSNLLISPAHPEVCDAPEDKAEERVEKTGENGEDYLMCQ